MSTTYTKNEIIEILKDNSQNDRLFSLTDQTRKTNVGDEVHLRALIEFSNICKCSCKYCGLRSPNKEIERYRIPEEKLLQQAKKTAAMGYKTIVLQSGEDNYYSTEILCKLIEQIKALNVALTLSIGERSFEDYKAFKEAGADRYLIRIETSDKNLYEKIHPNMSFENRLRCLENLKNLGYEVGTGCIVGLPEQTLESLAQDLLFFKNFDADMIGIGPFIPHPQTPFANLPHGDLTLSLKVMALTRILLPKINIPATTAMETLAQNGRILALQSGANVIMPNLTDYEYQNKYEIYPDKCNANSFSTPEISLLEEKLKAIGRKVSTTYGNSLNKKS